MNDLKEGLFRNAGKYSGNLRVVIGANVTKIPEYLFEAPAYSSDNPRIRSVVFEDGSVCQSIGNFAFYGCSELNYITIPASVTSVGRCVFYGCTSLGSISFEDTSNWYRSEYYPLTGGTSISVESPTANATYFKSTYYHDYWYKQ